MWHKGTSLQNRLTGTEHRLVVGKGERGREGMDWEFGFSRSKLLHLEWIKNKVLLCNTGNYIHLCIQTIMEKNILKNNVYMCIIESLCYTAENQYIINQLYYNKKNFSM